MLKFALRTLALAAIAAALVSNASADQITLADAADNCLYSPGSWGVGNDNEVGTILTVGPGARRQHGGWV